MSTKFFTNRDGNSLLKKFEGVFTHVPSIYFFDALIGYFRASGYFKVRPFLDRINRIRILVGINVDELTKQFNEKGQRYIHDSSSAKEKFVGEIVADIESAEYDLETEKGILQFIDDLVNDKIELRTHPEKRLHAKIYIFRPQALNEHSPCEVITGSSNVTDARIRYLRTLQLRIQCEPSRLPRCKICNRRIRPALERVNTLVENRGRFN